MKVLHTSDWHLGRSLFGRKRYDEFDAFLNWLIETITAEQIDVLLIAGDIFDTNTPSNRAQSLYYDFLCKVSASSCCQHIVVIAGNHDSPSFLNAPKALLNALNVYVVGAMTDNPADEVILLKDRIQQPQALICAVPYLRDKDIRTAAPGETIDDKNTKLIDGLKQHYIEVCAVAEQQQATFAKDQINIPIIGMGHLFAAGGKTVDNDGVRDLYVGSLAHVTADIFPSSLDYLALGHLHVPQIVGGKNHIRYCGSPIPMGYGEATQTKKVIIVAFNAEQSTIQEIDVPCFQPLVRIAGDLDHINQKLTQLVTGKSNAWLEVEYTGGEVVANLKETIDEKITGSAMEVRRIKNKQMIDRVMQNLQVNETLDDLNETDVFARCLDAFEVPDTDRTELLASYGEIMQTIAEEDKNAE
jgi:exonuclease SbcD